MLRTLLGPGVNRPDDILQPVLDYMVDALVVRDFIFIHVHLSFDLECPIFSDLIHPPTQQRMFEAKCPAEDFP